MRALSVLPGEKDSDRLDEIDEPDRAEGSVLVATVAVGVCGTDHEILSGAYGQAPAGEERLVLGHESVGRVLEAPVDSDLSEGDLVVGIVRRPDPVPCANCAVGEWDMCRNGRFTEHGIKGLHGFARERYRAEPDALVAVDGALGELGVLLEPTSVVAKAWEHVQRIGSRAHFEPATALVTGAGPVGLLAAMIGVQSGYDVHVLDQVTDGAKPQLVHDLGATYHSEPVEDLDLRPDVVVECTGVGPVVAGVLTCTGPNGIICLTGVSSPGRTMPLDLGALNREWVLENDVVFGSVNANRRHYELAGEALAQADRSWLDRLVTRAVPLEDYHDALDKHDDDIKNLITFEEPA